MSQNLQKNGRCAWAAVTTVGQHTLFGSKSCSYNRLSLACRIFGCSLSAIITNCCSPSLYYAQRECSWRDHPSLLLSPLPHYPLGSVDISPVFSYPTLGRKVPITSFYVCTTFFFSCNGSSDMWQPSVFSRKTRSHVHFSYSGKYVSWISLA